MKNRNIILTIILLTLGSFALPPRMQAVVPPPDGGYPRFNTAEGQNALFSLTTGQWNTALGAFTLRSDTDGSYNTAVGTAALLNNIGDQSTGDGIENTAIGAAALLLNTTGSLNTATGVLALENNTTGSDNTANGVEALFSNTTGSENTATGDYALFRNTIGNYNTANGGGALQFNTIGTFNTANGVRALQDNTSGNYNTANGGGALSSNTDGHDNTATGNGALSSITTGEFNTALGVGAGDNLTTSDSNNIDIGYNVEGAAGESNTIRIGSQQMGFAITDTFIQGISGATAAGGDAVFVTSGGRLGTLTSSARFKDEIKPMGTASEAILALRPVSFRYKKQIDPQGIPEFGLIAEEVEKVNPALITRDREGKPYTVRYEQINAMLLNEFLKAHRRIQDQETTITQLTKEMETVVAHAKEQDSRIQKLSDQIEINKAKPVMVRNDPRRMESNTSPQ